MFKGDLNYRKLVGDRTWAVDTPFATALHGFRPGPLCVLRTLKCNTVAGVAAEAAARAAAEDDTWMVSGKWAVIQACL